MAHNAPRKLAAVLFSDMKGYSRQMGEDEAGTLRRLDVHNRIFRELAERHHGRVVKTVGDAFMIEFVSAVEAVSCGLDVQRALSAYNAQREAAEHIEVRIGVHLGDVVVQDGDLFGETVNLAARLEPKAPPGGLCVTDAVLQQVRRRVNATATDLGQPPLKNIAQPLRLYALMPAETMLEDVIVPSSPASLPPLWRRGMLLIGVVAVAAMVVLQVVRRVSPPVGGTITVGMRTPLGAMELYGNVPGLGYSAMMYAIETLAEEGPEGGIEGLLVDKIDEREDGRSIVLHVRDGVRFHDHPCVGAGTTLTAADVVYSLEEGLRFFSPGSLTVTGFDAFLSGSTPHIEGISHDEKTVTIRLDAPSPFIGPTLALIRVVPAAIARCSMTLSSLHHPVGTGPYLFRRAAQGELVEVQRFKHYWRDDSAAPSLERIRLTHIADLDEAVARLRAGTLDIVTLRPAESLALLSGVLEGQPAFKRPDAARDPAVAIETRPGEHTTWSILALRGRPGEGALAHPSVRHALAFALDRQALVGAHPLRPRAHGRLLEPRHLGHSLDVEGFRFDLAHARKLLADAGFPDGKGLLPITVGVNVNEAAVQDLLERQWEALGVSVRAVEMDRQALDLAVAQRNVDAVVVTHTAKFLGTEPWPFLTGMAAYVEHFLGPHPQLRPLVADIVREVDRRKRAALYSRLESALLDATWVIPIAAFEPSAPIKIHLVGKRVQGYVSTATGHVPPEEDLPLLHTTMSR